jgi:hypothetical protein
LVDSALSFLLSIAVLALLYLFRRPLRALSSSGEVWRK